MQKKVLFSKEQIQERVAAMAAQIDSLYAGEELVVICVLKGAFAFFSDLLRNMKTDVIIDFVRLASYGNKTLSTHIEITKDVEISLEGRHVLIVEDIVDSGKSMDFFTRYLSSRGATSIRIAALINKHGRREKSIEPDFAGFEMEDGFIVGYGLDFAEKYRNLDAIYELYDFTL